MIAVSGSCHFCNYVLSSCHQDMKPRLFFPLFFFSYFQGRTTRVLSVKPMPSLGHVLQASICQIKFLNYEFVNKLLAVMQFNTRHGTKSIPSKLLNFLTMHFSSIDCHDTSTNYICLFSTLYSQHFLADDLALGLVQTNLCLVMKILDPLERFVAPI